MQIVVAAGQKTQAAEVIGKISTFARDSTLVQREISELRESGTDPIVRFHNGSWIKTVAAHDGARGGRSNLLIIDEFRMVSPDVINTVLRRFQTASRRVGFTDNPEFKKLPQEEQLKYIEQNQEVYLSSAYFKSDPSWDQVKDYAKQMAKGRSYFVCQLPYQLALKEGLLDARQIRSEMQESGFDEVKWEMEMNAQFWGASENSYFEHKEIEKNRKLRRVFYPSETKDLLSDSRIGRIPKEKGEIRVVSADIATLGGKDHDASIYSLGRMIPNDRGEYERQIVYMESMEGGHTQTQAIRIRELYEDFDADYIVLDTQGVGIGVYDALVTELVNPNTGEIYSPISCMNDEELAKRCTYSRAPKVVYSVRATDSINSNAATLLKDALKKGKIKFPVHEQDVDDIVTHYSGYGKLSPTEQALFKVPFVQTTLLTHEMLNLKREVKSNGMIKLTEPRSGRKDRYSSVSYLNYFAHEYEVKHRKHGSTDDTSASAMFFARQSRLY